MDLRLKLPCFEDDYRMNTEKRILTNCSRNRYQIRIWLAATCRNHMPIYFKTFYILYTTIFNNLRNIVNSIFFIFFLLLLPFIIIITILFCDYSCKVAG